MVDVTNAAILQNLLCRAAGANYLHVLQMYGNVSELSDGAPSSGRQVNQSKTVSAGLSLTCALCGFIASSHDNLVYHSRLGHNSFQCTQCEFVGRKGLELENHMTTRHNSSICIYCGFESGNTKALKRHYSVDHRSKEKKCKQCSFTTSSLTELTHHTNSMHRGRKPLSCPYCDYVTYAKICIRQHLMAVHIKEDLYCCPQCPLKFQRKFQVKDHLMRAHNMEMTPTISEELNRAYQAGFQSILYQHQLLDNTQDKKDEAELKHNDSNVVSNISIVE